LHGAKPGPVNAEAAGLIDALRLVPHPEGGYYRETYRSAARVTTPRGSDRSALTCIYFLLTAEGFSGVEPGRPTDFWIPLQNRPELTPWGSSPKEQTLYGSPNWWCLRLIARLAPGMEVQRAMAEVAPEFRAASYASLGAPAAGHPAATLSLVPAPGIQGVSDPSREQMPVLAALAALLVLMACGYVAMRIRVRKAARRQEQQSSGEIVS